MQFARRVDSKTIARLSIIFICVCLSFFFQATDALITDKEKKRDLKESSFEIFFFFEKIVIKSKCSNE